ncbi:hypothetical protein [Nocardia sp. NPDC049149]|uniref:WXG100-like domain-containing protein n=1 Tax=Nocardia sp. NPDC049149 TaxID=3364315 RepID=UPI00371C27BB
MAIDLPQEVAFVLNMMGVPWPDVNEDDVLKLAEHVRTFAQNVANTHEAATGTITDMGSVYSGHSYSALLSSWGRMSSTHMADLDQACRMVARALEMAANAISLIKVVAIAEIAALAGTYLAVLVTPGGGPLAPLLSMAARKITTQVEQSVVAYVLAEVVSKALEPFEKAIDDMIKGLAYNAASDILDVPDSSSKQALYIEPDEVLRYAGVLDAHADDILQHAATFADSVATLDFSMYSGADVPVVSPDAVSGPPLRLPLDLPLLNVPDMAALLNSSPELPRASIDTDVAPIGERSPDLTHLGSDARPAESAAGSPHTAAPAGLGPNMESAAAHSGSPVGPGLSDRQPLVSGAVDESATGRGLGSGEDAPTGGSTRPDHSGSLSQGEHAIGPLTTPVGAGTPNVIGGQFVQSVDAGGRTPGAVDSTAHTAPQHGASQQGSPQQGAPQSPGGRGASGPATPWARAVRPTSKGKAAKTPTPPPVTAPSDAGSGRTPWSKPDREPDAAKVFAPGGGKTAGGDAPENVDVPAKVSAPARSEGPPKSDASAKINVPKHSDGPARSEGPEKSDAPAKSGGSERSARSKGPEKSDAPERSDAPAKSRGPEESGEPAESEGPENRTGGDESTAAALARSAVTVSEGLRR